MTKQLPKRIKIGVLGCGSMGSSIIRGLVDHSFYPQYIHVFDTQLKQVRNLKKDINFRAAKSGRQVASIVDVLILAVKPQVMDAVLEEIGLVLRKNTLVISIAAGVKIAKFEKAFKEKVPVIRVMPNMPAQVGEGMSAYCLGSFVNSNHQKMAEIILGSIGEVVQVKENVMDLVTAISGSGPAYFFLLAEKMIEAACEMGLKSHTAKKLVYQTALGSAKALRSSDEDPDVLIGRVASRRGTTEEALKVYRRKGFGKIVHDAVKAACRRSKELSQ